MHAPSRHEVSLLLICGLCTQGQRYASTRAQHQPSTSARRQARSEKTMVLADAFMRFASQQPVDPMGTTGTLRGASHYAVVPPKRKPSRSCSSRGMMPLSRLLKMLVKVIVKSPLADFVAPRACASGADCYDRARSAPNRKLGRTRQRMKIPAEAGTFKKCGNNLLSPRDYHRPYRLNYRVRNGNGCDPARKVTAPG